MTERGVVVKVKGKRATVRFDRRSACDSCHMCAVTRDGMKVEVVIENTLGANVGDFVEVEMAQKFVLTAAVIVYLIPLVLVAFGVGVGVIFSEAKSISTRRISLGYCTSSCAFKRDTQRIDKISLASCLPIRPNFFIKYQWTIFLT